MLIMSGKELGLALRNINTFYPSVPTPCCCHINRRVGTLSGLDGSGLGGMTGAIINAMWCLYMGKLQSTGSCNPSHCCRPGRKQGLQHTALHRFPLLLDSASVWPPQSCTILTTMAGVSSTNWKSLKYLLEQQNWFNFTMFQVLYEASTCIHLRVTITMNSLPFTYEETLEDAYFVPDLTIEWESQSLGPEAS